MPQPYSQQRALWAITRASFTAIFKQPTAIVFSLFFPIIFILIFGAFGNDGLPTYKVALAQNSDTSNVFYTVLKNSGQIRLVNYPDSISQNNDLNKGRLTAVISIKVVKDSLQQPHYVIKTRTTTASSNTFGGLTHALDYVKLKFETGL